jgi:hypothetical protein
VLLASCHTATQPSPPPETQPSPPVSPSPLPAGPDALVILPALSGITLGASATLAAVVTSGGVPGRPVAASWASDAPDVAPVQADGHVYGSQFGETTIRAAYETFTASLPLRVVPDYAGHWSGWHRVTRCIRISGSAPSTCRFIEGGRFGLRIELTQNGATLSGLIDFLDKSNTVLIERGIVQGEIDVTNSLVLTGTTVGGGQSTLSEWTTALSVDTGQMVGGFVRNRKYRNDFGDQELKLTCELDGISAIKTLTQ